jgi:hypothetical protein
MFITGTWSFGPLKKVLNIYGDSYIIYLVNDSQALA